MRTWGRVQDTLTGAKTWVEVTTDANGFNDMVYLTALAQVCKLNLDESPFWADWGIPAHQSVMTQIPPDYYVALTQQRFAPHFMALTMMRMPNAIDETGRPAPYYAIAALTNLGATVTVNVPV
jgi:hypothetical protein